RCPPRRGGDRPRQRRRDPDGAAAPAGGGPQDRLGRRRPRHPAAGRRDRPAGDAGRGRAARGHAVPGDGAADPRRPGREHDLRRQQHLVRTARPPHPERRLPGGLTEPRADQRHHGRARPRVRRVGASHRLPARPGRVGRPLDRRPPGQAGGTGSEPVAPMSADVETIEPGTGRVRLTFAPDGGEVRVPAGTTLFDGASWNGVAIDSTCGGHGTCKKCKVRVATGEQAIDAVDPRAFTPDELKAGWRLACRAQAAADLVVEVPPLQTRPKAALAGVGRHVILRPAVQKRYLELEEPTLDDQRSDLERVRDAMDDLELRVEVGVLRKLGRTLRACDWKVTAVVVDDLLLDVEPGDTSARRHALAFDLGTTTVVATLLDLETGQPIAVRSMLNRQQPHGADVISRISATMMDPDALGRLQLRAQETLDALAGEVCEEAGVERAEVYEVVLAGNMTMTQLVLGIDPEPLSMVPFIVTARELPEMK